MIKILGCCGISAPVRIQVIITVLTAPPEREAGQDNPRPAGCGSDGK